VKRKEKLACDLNGEEKEKLTGLGFAKILFALSKMGM